MGKIVEIRTLSKVEEDREKRIEEFNQEYGIEARPGEDRLITLSRMHNKLDYGLASRWTVYQATGDESLFADKMEKRRAQVMDGMERVIKEEEDELINARIKEMGYNSEAEYMEALDKAAEKWIAQHPEDASLLDGLSTT